jgi:hypothetical protein
MKGIFLAFVLVFAFTTGMAAVTVVAHTDRTVDARATAADRLLESSVNLIP